MLFEIKILSNGDEVLNCWDDKIAVKRKNGEVEIFQVLWNEGELPQLSPDVWRITFGSGRVEISEGKKAARKSSRKKTPDSNDSVANVDDEPDFKISVRQPKQST